ncbi:MAG: helix-turn-helix transcriptional regulator [Vampirovibrionales bacterium]|nr:helix-turn-helix transcriptional regulator [Vampirovibrionales bacterium]
MRIRLRLDTVARQNKGWNLRRLAHELGVDYQNVLNWNNGRSNPRLPLLIQMSRLLHCQIDHLIATPDDAFKVKAPRTMLSSQAPRRRGRPKKKAQEAEA